jgi:hypothetical protein
VIKPKKLGFWIGLFVLACALVGIFAFSESHPETKFEARQITPSGQNSASSIQDYEGILTDTRCGAKHSAMIELSAADCARACVHAGEHFALVDGERTYVLQGDPQLMKRLAGERVKISGTLNGTTIDVTSISEANPKAE